MQCPGRGTKAVRERSAQRIDNSIEVSTSSRAEGKGVHSSNAIVISAPSRCWISTERSGVSKWRLPSRCERKVTPSSPIFRKAASDMT